MAEYCSLPNAVPELCHNADGPAIENGSNGGRARRTALKYYAYTSRLTRLMYSFIHTNLRKYSK